MRHRGRASGNGLRGDSIENLFQRIPEMTRAKRTSQNANAKWFFFSELTLRVIDPPPPEGESEWTSPTTEDEVVEMIRCCGYLVLGLASGLEAFSREPPCDSIGALAARQTPETSGMAREFLSYYPLLPSRYLRDPSTISAVLRLQLMEFSLNGLIMDNATKYALPSDAQEQHPVRFARISLAISG